MAPDTGTEQVSRGTSIKVSVQVLSYEILKKGEEGRESFPFVCHITIIDTHCRLGKEC